MTVTETSRLGLKLYSAGSDPWPGRIGWNALMGLLEGQAAEWAQGELAARPVAGTPGRMYWATDAKRKYWDDGVTWTEESPVGGGGTPTRDKIGAAGAEGTSRIAARADHSHPITEPGLPAAMTFGGAGAAGASDTPARADHTHPLPALPARVMPFDYYHGGQSDAVVASLAPGFAYGDAYKLDFNITHVGVVDWRAGIPIITDANAAVWINVKVSGVIHNRVRFHNRNKPGLHVVPLGCLFTYPGNVACAIRVEVYADAANTGTVTVHDASGYIGVIA